MQEAVTQKNQIYTAIYNSPATTEQPPVVLIRGLGRVIEHWHGFHEQVAKRFPTIVFDNKGMGRSKAGIGLSATIAEFAEHLVEVLDHWEIKQAHFVGISLGGMIAIEAARLFPDRTLSYCAINSSANFRLGMRLSLTGLYEFGKQGLTGGKSEDTLFDAMVATKSVAKKKKLLREWDEIRQKYGLNGYNTLCQLKAAFLFGASSKWDDIKAPGLIAVGEKDRLVPPANSKYLASKLPNAELLSLAGAGHELLMDAGDEFLNHYQKFVDAV